MAEINTYAPVVVAERDRRTNDSTGSTVNPPAAPADSAEITGHSANDALVPGEPVAIDRFIADVLRRAHQSAEALNAPDEARAILGVALLFADDLAKMNLRFDRLRFIQAATEPSD